MFKRFFKKNSTKAAATAALDVRSKRPSAGEIRVEGATETLFLSPLPVYTGQVQGSRRQFSDINEVFLDLGGSNWGTVEGVKMLAGGIVGLLVLAFIVPALIMLYLVLAYPENFPAPLADLKMFIQVFSAGALLGLLPLGAFAYGMFGDEFKGAKPYPVRFNRQRREVCYIDRNSGRALIVPWESVVAWVSNAQGVTPYGATRQYTFGMGLEDEERDTVQFVLLPQPSDSHSLGLWASIRNYMEDGQLFNAPNPWFQALGLVPTEDRLKPYEGMHTFEIEREDARAMGSLDDGGEDLTPEQREQYGYGKRSWWPLRRWYVWRVLTFWKLPYLLAEWTHRRARPAIPAEVSAWSAPLPEDQWAAPSPTLVKANQVVRALMDKQGATFVDACKAAGLSGIHAHPRLKGASPAR